MSSPPASSAGLPSDRSLDEAVATLVDRRDNVAVIQVVEAWAAQGTPSLAARLHVGRAFFNLRMMDRATSRAREVLEQDSANAPARRLLAEIYIERGWPVKARVPLLELRQGGTRDPEIEALWERAQSEPVRPDLNARQIEREGEPEKLLALAEAFLATGSFLRGTGILERLRRNDPDNPRVRELLWGVAGDTSLGDMTLGQALRVLLPTASLPQLAGIDEPEHTESFSDTTQNDLAEAAGADEVAFPNLFKHGARPVEPDPDETGEHTAASLLADTHRAGESDATDAGRTDGGRTDGAAGPRGASSGDTQIMLVLRPGEDVKAAHRRREGKKDALRESLNLLAYQSSMGMSGLGPSDAPDVEPEDDERSEVGVGDDRDVPTSDSDEDLLEEEDENIVVMTRTEGETLSPDANTSDHESPIEVIEKHPVPVVRPATWSATPVVEDDPPPPPEPPPAEPVAPEPAWSPPPSNRWLILGVAALGLAMMAIVGLIVGSRLWSFAAAGGDPRAEVVEALASADYETLLEEEGLLEGRMRAAGSPAIAAALAETRLVLWSDFNGDPARVEFVQDLLSHPEGIDVHRLAMLRAAYAWAREDYAGANAAISRQEPQDDEERLLFARLAAATADPSRTLEHFTRMDRPDAPRYALARARILAAMGQVDEARTLANGVVEDHPSHVLGNLVVAELAPGEAKDRVAAADLFLSRFRGRSIAPRIEGQAHALRARAYAEFSLLGKAREAADAGLARDGTNPTLLLVVAQDEAQRGELVAALGELETITASRPGNVEAQTARILVLLDLDRVDQAAEVVASLRDAQLLPQLTPILQGLVTTIGRSAPLAVPVGPKEAETPLGAWLNALVAVQGHAADAPAAVESAITLLGASPAGFERALVPRARALAVLAAPPEEAQALADKVEPEVATDAVAQVYLARYYERGGRRALAAQHFDRAAEVGPQLGLAWYEKGRFYQDARDSLGRSSEAWRAYLKLGPSGPRAERVTKALRRP